MAKPYSQDLRDRVIDAVKRGEMSRRAAARRFEISESVAIKWLERVERDGSREPVAMIIVIRLSPERRGELLHAH
jgi:transposase